MEEINIGHYTGRIDEHPDIIEGNDRIYASIPYRRKRAEMEDQIITRINQYLTHEGFSADEINSIFSKDMTPRMAVDLAIDSLSVPIPINSTCNMQEITEYLKNKVARIEDEEKKEAIDNEPHDNIAPDYGNETQTNEIGEFMNEIEEHDDPPSFMNILPQRQQKQAVTKHAVQPPVEQQKPTERITDNMLGALSNIGIPVNKPLDTPPKEQSPLNKFEAAIINIARDSTSKSDATVFDALDLERAATIFAEGVFKTKSLSCIVLAATYRDALCDGSHTSSAHLRFAQYAAIAAIKCAPSDAATIVQDNQKLVQIIEFIDIAESVNGAVSSDIIAAVLRSGNAALINRYMNAAVSVDVAKQALRGIKKESSGVIALERIMAICGAAYVYKMLH